MSINSDKIAALLYLKKKLHKWKTVAVLSVTVSFLLLVGNLFGNSFSSKSITGNYIASVKIDGIIFENDYRSEVLAKIADEKSIKAVIVKVNSPGGGIVGSEILFENLKDIASKKPIVVVMESLAASGGYMIAVASDYIIARNGTLTGSIGVIMQSAEITDLAEKIGVKFNTYKSSPLKGTPSPFEKSNSAVNQAISQSIEDSYKFFADLVKENRKEKLNKAMLSQIFDGRVFTGRQALKAGLVDEIGGEKEALLYLESQKIDISLPVKEVEIDEKEKDLVGKLFGLLPFFHQAKSAQNHQIMAILPL